ncbi:hypothetical protein FHJ31_05660 [Pseudomonas sp. Fig-3]|jgi:hypothetical protein|uniref:hypothetical protein n=1 Tax=Pseudomonas TaxID=286 RepID=UPI0010EA4608|nr:MULTISPECIES: hypothetical protein [unclassified Pseudomonas]MBD0704750.1 hypothetical protein [Pseudomonas sp. PSB1]MDR8386392.1 hypothetical protein [Pseudomonas sp. JL2]TNB87933.1 hypothetical protein FHJ31_05660 [Pseudomonas sp. Fig-3]WNZ78118.1 hypothetical protein QOM08_26165 [Pseudomonas sp. P105]VII94503.1 hypothetical protein [Pseudomonas sp. FG-3G]
MVKTLALLLLTASLAACGSHPQAAPEAVTPSEPKTGCYQAEWQAETNPVLNKRSGPDGLDKYETQVPAKEHGCP